MDFDQFAETTAFKQVAQTITALSTQDERIADEFRAIEQGRVSSGKIVEIEGDIPVGMKMRLGDFAEAISTRVWTSVGRANWRKFEDARDFVAVAAYLRPYRSFKSARAFVRGWLKSQAEWFAYVRSGKKPADIPVAPSGTYRDKGWAGYGDWLGNGTVAT